MTILQADEEPAIKKAQAPAQWQDIAKEYSTEAAALHPFSMALSTPTAENSNRAAIRGQCHYEKMQINLLYQQTMSNNSDSLTKPMEAPTLLRQTALTYSMTTGRIRNHSPL